MVVRKTYTSTDLNENNYYVKKTNYKSRLKGNGGLSYLPTKTMCSLVCFQMWHPQIASFSHPGLNSHAMTVCFFFFFLSNITFYKIIKQIITEKTDYMT